MMAIRFAKMGVLASVVGIEIAVAAVSAVETGCGGGDDTPPASMTTTDASLADGPAMSVTPGPDGAVADRDAATLADDAGDDAPTTSAPDAASSGDDAGVDGAAEGGSDSGTSNSDCTTTYMGTCLTATSVSAGNDTSFALMSDHSVYGWGSNADEAVGSVTGNPTKPVRLPGVENIVQLSAYFNHTCAVDQAGDVLCWGTQTNGELGEGVNGPSTGGSMTPVTVAGMSNAKQVAAGAQHNCAVTNAGSVWCWGSNIDGACGQPRPNTGDYTFAAEVSGLTGVTRVVSGDDYSCALLTGGTVSCWGNNGVGQLGDGTRTDRFAPVDVGLSNVVEIEAGASQACARKSTGDILCWGDDGYGQLGDGETTDAGQPSHVTPQGIAGASSLALGFTASTAIVGSQTYVFGSNYWVVFGIFPSPPDGSTTPIASAKLAGASSIAMGRTHACGIFGTTVKCWGSGQEGAIGNGSSGGEAIPQTVVWD